MCRIRIRSPFLTRHLAHVRDSQVAGAGDDKAAKAAAERQLKPALEAQARYQARAAQLEDKKVGCWDAAQRRHLSSSEAITGTNLGFRGSVPIGAGASCCGHRAGTKPMAPPAMRPPSPLKPPLPLPLNVLHSQVKVPRVDLGSLEEVLGRMEADARGEWADVLFIPSGTMTRTEKKKRR